MFTNVKNQKWEEYICEKWLLTKEDQSLNALSQRWTLEEQESFATQTANIEPN